MSDFIKKFIIDDGECDFINEIKEDENKKENNIKENNNIENNFKNKYLKYKIKYLLLKNKV
jgi:hypothetical protein